jgi:hypothetical protein
MATTIEPRQATEQVWHQLARGSFAVLSHVTPTGEPRSSGVLYKAVGRRLYVAVAPDSWKARHIAVGRRVAVTVPVRRGGILSLVAPIPPATISFHGTAIVHPAGSAEAGTLARELGSLLPAERQASASVIEITPEGAFVPTAWASRCCACASRPPPGPACRWPWPEAARWTSWPSHGAWSG